MPFNTNSKEQFAANMRQQLENCLATSPQSDCYRAYNEIMRKYGDAMSAAIIQPSNLAIVLFFIIVIFALILIIYKYNSLKLNNWFYMTFNFRNSAMAGAIKDKYRIAEEIIYS